MEENPYVYARPASLEEDGRSAPSQTGETLRDKYAGLAPDDIPYWFTPFDMPPKPVPEATLNSLFGQDSSAGEEQKIMFEFYDQVNMVWRDSDYVLAQGFPNVIDPAFKAEVDYQQQLIIQRNNEIANWQVEYDRERFYQWRWRYADDMLQFRLEDKS